MLIETPDGRQNDYNDTEKWSDGQILDEVIEVLGIGSDTNLMMAKLRYWQAMVKNLENNHGLL